MKHKRILLNICAAALTVCMVFGGCVVFGGCAATAGEGASGADGASSTDGASVSPQDGGSSAPAESAAPGGDSSTSAAPAAGSKAALWLESGLAALDNTLYVYKDFADGVNNFTQKAWMGDSNLNIPAMNEAAEGYDGTTGIAAELDLSKHLWGGYMFLNGSLAAGSTVPVPDFGKTDCGIDLTGAVKLVFFAKGETGREKVEFFMGGMGWNGVFKNAAFPDSTQNISLGVVPLSADWQEYEIDLSGADLSRVGCGFGWVTNDTNNPGLTSVKFYMDDIHYEFAGPKADSGAGPKAGAGAGPVFLQSYASAAPGTNQAIINNFAYLYDNAVAALALSYAGEDARAGQIADAIVYALDHDRFYSDGRLRNAYSSGDPRSFPGWYSGKGTGFARMPGFYDPGDGAWYEDYYAVSSSTGNMAWAMLALVRVYEKSPGRTDYLDAARRIGDFVLTLKDGKGGFAGGYEGWEPNAVRVTYKSTEHNIDLISAFGRLAGITGEQKYADAAAWAKGFVLSMYDKDRGVFYTGTTDDGVTVNKDVLPLDCNTWAILALDCVASPARTGVDGAAALAGADSAGALAGVDGAAARTGVDGAAVMDFVERNMAVDGGYDFNTDRDGVWFEGTAQAALAYKQLGNTQKYNKILEFLNANQLPDGSIPAADRDGVTTGFLVSGTDIPWKYDNRPHVGATAWLAFAQLGRNPLATE